MAAHRSSGAAGFEGLFAPLLTACLVLQWGGARIFNFNPSETGGTAGTAVAEALIFLTNVITVVVLLIAPNCATFLRKCWPVLCLPGLAILSSIWSVYPYLTFRAGVSYALTTLIGFAIAGALPPQLALRTVVRAMGYCCAISVAVALALPELGVHQATDTVQIVHAGYWRGIMGHKIGLGIFAGVALPLLVLHGRLVFPWLWVVFAGCALTCLVNAGSATAYAGTILFATFLVCFKLALTRKGPQRTGVVAVLIWTAAILLSATIFGAMNWLAVVFDKSTDLTGRSDMWPLISALIGAEWLGRLIGYGYLAGIKVFVAPAVGPYMGGPPSDCHNGYLETLVAFGYIGSSVVLLVHLWLFRGFRQLLLRAPARYAGIAALPMSLFFSASFLNYSESLLMNYAALFTQFTPIAAVWMFRLSDPGGRTAAIRRPGS